AGLGAKAHLGEHHRLAHRLQQPQLFEGGVEVAGRVMAEALHQGRQAAPPGSGQALVWIELLVPAEQRQHPHQVVGRDEVAGAGRRPMGHQHAAGADQLGTRQEGIVEGGIRPLTRWL
ncbi:MAG: hypothetical protein ACK56I_31960, partial [bacterium]